MEKLGVVSKINSPTDWCAGMVVVPKSNGKVRICVDLTRLNDSVCRERHPLPAVDQTLAQLAGAKIFQSLMPTPVFGKYPYPESQSRLQRLSLHWGDSAFTDCRLASLQHLSISSVACLSSLVTSRESFA